MSLVHALRASITSAMVMKPSTLYIIRVENTQSKQTWHLRRCFSDFCELRDKILVLLALQNTKNQLEIAFPELYKRFPRRQLFGSRTKRVIAYRTKALNRFLDALWSLLQRMQQQQQIAMSFGLMNYIETFLDCRQHDAKHHQEELDFRPRMLTLVEERLPPTQEENEDLDDESEDEEERLVLQKAASCHWMLQPPKRMEPEDEEQAASAWRQRSHSAVDQPKASSSNWATRIAIAGLTTAMQQEHP